MKALIASSREARAAGLFAATAGLLIARARQSRALSTRADVPPAPPAFRARVLSLREPNYGAPAGEEEARLLSSARLGVRDVFLNRRTHARSAANCYTLGRQLLCRSTV